MIAEIIDIPKVDVYNDVKQNFIGKKVELTIRSRHRGGGYWTGSFFLKQRVSFKVGEYPKTTMTFLKGRIICFVSVKLKMI